MDTGVDFANIQEEFDPKLVERFAKSPTTLDKLSKLLMRLDLYLTSPKENKSISVKLDTKFISDLSKADFGEDYDFAYNFLFLILRQVDRDFVFEETDLLENNAYNSDQKTFFLSLDNFIPAKLLSKEGKAKLMNALFEKCLTGFTLPSHPQSITLI